MLDFDEFELDDGPSGFPGELSFVHRRLFSAGKKFLTTGSPFAAAGAFVMGGGAKRFIDFAGLPTNRATLGTLQPRNKCNQGEFNNVQKRIGPGGEVCVVASSLSGAPPPSSLVARGDFDVGDFLDTSGGFGVAVMGRFGAALQPEVRQSVTLRCPRGAVLGIDNLCYNKRDLDKRDRKWIPGRKPLLTGGDLNAIARAARAAGKMKTQQKRLEKLGLLKKSKAAARKTKSGPTEHHHHD